MTKEEKKEVLLYEKWRHSKEKEILEEYAGEPIENVPKKYREKIARLREFGLWEKEKTTYEQVMEFLETHEGKIMRGTIYKNGKKLKRKNITEEEREEVKT